MNGRSLKASTLLTILLLWVALYAGAAIAKGPSENAEVQRGHYLAVAGDCEQCHSTAHGEPYAGGLAVRTPIGSVYSTNITPSKSDGIGDYTLQQFSDAVRKGIRGDGAHLYPAMPYTAYAQLTDKDVRALYAYFMHGVKPVDHSPQRTHLPFPFNIRLSMMAWNFLFLNDKHFKSDPHKSAKWNRGAYLVRGLAHCGTCHTPRNWLMAEQSSQALSGASLNGWFSPNITPDKNSGVGNWTKREIVHYLKHGHVDGKAQTAGPMAEAVDNSLRYLSKADLSAIAVYLKTIPAHHNPKDTRPADAWGKPYANLASIRGKPLPKNPDKMTGPQLYDAYCATCHQDHGQGSFHGGLPRLFHNTATGRRNTNNLVMVILNGVVRKTDGSNGLRMPGFERHLSDRQVVTLGNYVTQHFGNPKAKVTRDQVKTLRAGGSSSNLVLVARVIIAIVIVIVILIIVAIVRALVRRRRRSSPRPEH